MNYGESFGKSEVKITTYDSANGKFYFTDIISFNDKLLKESVVEVIHFKGPIKFTVNNNVILMALPIFPVPAIAVMSVPYLPVLGVGGPTHSVIALILESGDWIFTEKFSAGVIFFWSKTKNIDIAKSNENIAFKREKGYFEAKREKAYYNRNLE